MFNFEHLFSHAYVIATVLPAKEWIFFSFLVKVANSAIISQVCVIES